MNYTMLIYIVGVLYMHDAVCMLKKKKHNCEMYVWGQHRILASALIKQQSVILHEINRHDFMLIRETKSTTNIVVTIKEYNPYIIPYKDGDKIRTLHFYSKEDVLSFFSPIKQHT